MRVLILGIDGYIGWPLALTLLNNKHEVCGLDNFIRRKRVDAIGSNSLTPIVTPMERKIILRRYDNFIDQIAEITLSEFHYFGMSRVLAEFKPEVIIHLAEQPSAPWSMRDAESATITQRQNILGTLHLLWAMYQECPDSHLIKLGTMGEYGTPECFIPEGYIPWDCIGKDEIFHDTEAGCPMKGLPFPKQPGSWYHLSKVHDTYNINFACRNWKLRCTDIMQGVVYGLGGFDAEFITRFDYDEYFGTAINRFCAQAIVGHPLTVYGKGGQTRGFLPLKDSLKCIQLAMKHQPKAGDHRIFNQYESTYKIIDLAYMVKKAARNLGIYCDVKHYPNPREELEEHTYRTSNFNLTKIGYKPTTDTEGELVELLSNIYDYHDRVNRDVIVPRTVWNKDRLKI